MTSSDYIQKSWGKWQIYMQSANAGIRTRDLLITERARYRLSHHITTTRLLVGYPNVYMKKPGKVGPVKIFTVRRQDFSSRLLNVCVVFDESVVHGEQFTQHKQLLEIFRSFPCWRG